MSGIEAQDAAFFQMLSQTAIEPAAESADERRRKSRNNFPTVQAMAPYINGSLPPREMLRPVQCNDLSTTGIAYFATEWPRYDRLVVALATANRVIYLTAGVVHTKRLSPDDEPALYQVGCRFIGRVQL
ncbi:MAG TPA: hypothetical protein VIK18_14690 [Pirellulales bacterium]